jgi:hypothetical protein
VKQQQQQQQHALARISLAISASPALVAVCITASYGSGGFVLSWYPCEQAKAKVVV